MEQSGLQEALANSCAEKYHVAVSESPKTRNFGALENYYMV